MDTIELITKTIRVRYSENDVTITPANNGGILIKINELSEEIDLPTVINLVAEIFYEYDCQDIELITHKDELEVYIDILKMEDY